MSGHVADVPGLTVRVAETDADLEPGGRSHRGAAERALRDGRVDAPEHDPERVYLVAELDGALAG